MQTDETQKKSPFSEIGMFAEANPLLFKLAKELRKNQTHAENLLWQYLKKGINGLKFRRQHPIGIYIADFYCHKLKLIIEIDGSIHNLEANKINDIIREKDLRVLGCNIIRFTNKQITHDIENVLLEINSLINNINNGF